MRFSLPSTPREFRGVWRRKLYAEPADEPYQHTDTATQVCWLQGEHWHADLRLPAKGPDFSGITALKECNRAQLEWLAGITAFAGITQIESDLSNGLCTWHRYQDLLPSLERDVGVLRWLDDITLEERHPHGQYVEHWQRLANDAIEEVVQDAQGQLRWQQIGDHAIAITPRPAGNASELFSSISTANDDTLRWRASLCFNYLQRSHGVWQIVLSTQPWRKGQYVK